MKVQESVAEKHTHTKLSSLTEIAAFKGNENFQNGKNMKDEPSARPTR